MIIDRTHRGWALTAGGVLAVGALLYAVYASGSKGPRGGSGLGIAYGAVGFSMMVAAGLLGARSRVPVWRLGRAQTWMRAHIWLGMLSLPLIFFHAGFNFGGSLTTVLMWLLIVVVASGLAGAWLQHTMPRRILREVPLETIYEQIDHVRTQLVSEADTLVADACGKLDLQTVAPAPSERAQGHSAARAAATALATTVRIDEEESAPLRVFYMREMRPFIERPHSQHPLADHEKAAMRFETVRAALPVAFHPVLGDLQNICEEERQLMRQSRMHAVLHAWLLVHVPLSLALLTLAIMHIVAALRF